MPAAKKNYQVLKNGVVLKSLGEKGVKIKSYSQEMAMMID